MQIFLLLIRRTLQLIVLAFLVTSATFFLASLIPGDFFTLLETNPSIARETVTRLREQYGLDDPVYLQYWHWLQRSLYLDLGYSLIYGRPVAGVVLDALANTLWIGVPALFFGLLIGIVLGTLHALHQGRALGHTLDIISPVLLSLPSLLLGLLAMLVASRTHWFPIGGMTSSDPSQTTILLWTFDRLHHLILPVFCLTLPILASVERIQYAAARSILGESSLRSARSRGLSRFRIFVHYLLRPSLNPVVSTFGPMFAAMLSGSLVLEYIFLWPGLGKVTYDALFNKDIFLLLGCVTCGSLLLVLGNLAADFLLYILDPRTREYSNQVVA